MVAAMAWVGSGAGISPSDRANFIAPVHHMSG